MNIFIDTNILLSFYHFSSEDLEELKKLGVLLDQKKARLFLPEQVRDEFARNRAAKIVDAMKSLKALKLNAQFPQLCKDYQEYDELRKALRLAEGHLGTLQKKLETDISNVALKADQIITSLLRSSERIEITDQLLALARRRVDLGNPPGKQGSHGDAANWESLLEAVPADEDLFFVSGDGDYVSELDDESFDPFLATEWIKRKKSRILYYKRLSGFFKEKFPSIRLASELEKDLLIRDLATARNFASAKAVLRNLRRYSDLTAAQLNAIAYAAGQNDQVHRIMLDADVEPYFRGLLSDHHAEFEPQALKEIRYHLGDISSYEYHFGDGNAEQEADAPAA